jgi:CRP/FNR family transcriptional regulator, cyclic AMP receptor protein
MKQPPKTQAMKQSDLFDSFNPLEMNKIVGMAEEIELPKHQFLFAAGDKAQAIYFIEKGRVRLSRLASEGKEVLLGIFGPGDLIGDAIWESGYHESTAETLEDSKFYEIGEEVFQELLRTNPEFAGRIIEIMASRLKQAEARIEDLVFRQVPSRIARLLITLSESYGKVTTNGIRVDFRLTHQDIADLVGSSRVTVTQVLNKFRASGWIDIEGKRVTIHNSEALEDLVNHFP